MANDITPAMDLIAEALTDFYGERCPDFHPGCYCCEAWAQYDALAARPEPGGMRTTAEERSRWRRIMIGTPLEGGKVHCLVDDTDTLLAEVASLKVRLAAAEAEQGAAVAALAKAELLHQTGLLFADVEFIDEVERDRRSVLARNGITVDAIRARGGST